MARILIVEDEPLVQVLLEEIAEIAGFDLEAVVETVDEAREVIDRANFQVCILDVNLHGKTTEVLAELLKPMDVSVIVSTGSHPGELPEAYQDFTIVQKPFNMTQMITTLTQLAN